MPVHIPAKIILAFAAGILAATSIAGPAAAQGTTSRAIEAARNKMVDEEIVAAGVKNPRVVQARRE